MYIQGPWIRQDKTGQRFQGITVGLPHLSGHPVSFLPSPSHHLSLRSAVSTWCPYIKCRVPRLSSDHLGGRKESLSMLRVNPVACWGGLGSTFLQEQN